MSVGARIAAPASAIYEVLADYRDGHSRILPPRYFGPLTVERGGVGAGTVVRFTVRVFGRERAMRAIVTEATPNRRLVETDPDSGAVTTFDLTPEPDGAATTVTITTALRTRGGVAGAVERWLAALTLRPIYTDELARLASYVVGGDARGDGHSTRGG